MDVSFSSCAIAEVRVTHSDADLQGKYLNSSASLPSVFHSCILPARPCKSQHLWLCSPLHTEQVEAARTFCSDHSISCISYMSSGQLSLSLCSPPTQDPIFFTCLLLDFTCSPRLVPHGLLTMGLIFHYPKANIN